MVRSLGQRAILAALLLCAACQAPAPLPTPDPGPASLDAGAPALRGIVPASTSPYDLGQPAPEGFDRAGAQRETLRHLMNLIRIDTRNPPGHEAAAAAYLQSLFEHVSGVETEVLDVGDGRANFVARLRAPKPTERPVLILGHMDVVGAVEAKWTSPPFEPTIRGEYLYGRGAIDDKGGLAAAATAIVQLAARPAPLSRDVIFLATAGEEGGPPVGIDWMLEHRPDLLGDAEFALNEGGRIRVREGRIRSVNIQTTEKVPYNVKVTATGPSGHGSVPLPDNALAALSRAVSRLHEVRFPMRLNETTRLYFASLATIEPDPVLRQSMLDIVGYEGRARRLAEELLSRVPIYNAVLRTGQSLTMMEGGFRTNVIPSEGTANFNVRALPGDSMSTILANMRHAAGEPGVTIELVGEIHESPPPSPVDTALFRAMESAAHSMAAEAVVMPFLSTGATDGAALRASGIPTYGILPMPLAMEDELRMHGDDERVPVRALGWATEFLYRCLDEVCR